MSVDDEKDNKEIDIETKPIQRKRKQRIGKPRTLPVKKMIGVSNLEPYRILGVCIKYDAKEAELGTTKISNITKWDWQSVRRIFIGTRRTDFVELVILAKIISSNNKEEFDKLILKWASKIYDFIQNNIPLE